MIHTDFKYAYRVTHWITSPWSTDKNEQLFWNEEIAIEKHKEYEVYARKNNMLHNMPTLDKVLVLEYQGDSIIDKMEWYVIGTPCKIIAKETPI